MFIILMIEKKWFCCHYKFNYLVYYVCVFL